MYLLLLNEQSDFSFALSFALGLQLQAGAYAGTIEDQPTLRHLDTSFFVNFTKNKEHIASHMSHLGEVGCEEEVGKL